MGFKLETLGSLREKPKICLVGDSGGGKTHALLSLPGKKIVVDAENGMRAFGERFPDAIRLATQDPLEVNELLRAVLSGEHECNMVGIDPISTVWAQMQDLVGDYELRKAQNRARGKTIDELDVDFSYQTWRKIKKINRDIISAIRRLDMPVVVTCRSKAASEEKVRSDAFNGMVPDAEKTLIYEFDVVIWMTNTNGTRKAYVTKDRWGRLPKQIEGDVATALVKAFPGQWEEHAEDRPMPTDEQAAEWHRLLSMLEIPPEGVSKALRARGVSNFEDFTPETAEAILVDLRKKAGVTIEEQVA